MDWGIISPKYTRCLKTVKCISDVEAFALSKSSNNSATFRNQIKDQLNRCMGIAVLESRGLTKNENYCNAEQNCGKRIEQSIQKDRQGLADTVKLAFEGKYLLCSSFTKPAGLAMPGMSYIICIIVPVWLRELSFCQLAFQHILCPTSVAAALQRTSVTNRR